MTASVLILRVPTRCRSRQSRPGRLGLRRKDSNVSRLSAELAQRSEATKGETSEPELAAAIEHGAVNRVRPKLMTVLAIMLGLVPALWSRGAGASVMKRIAAPMVGGMVTSTVLTLIVIPVIYYLWRRRGHEETAP